jgi:hypothetical protein
VPLPRPSRAAWSAAAVGLLYAAISIYWGLGGTWLLDTVGRSLAGTTSTAALAAVWAAVALKLVAVVIPLLACRAESGLAHRRLRVLAWIEGGVLTAYGFVFTAVGLLVQVGAITAGRHADQRTLAWHAYLWDPWFLVWGVLVLTAMYSSRSGPRLR